MIALTRLSPQCRAEISLRMGRILQKFEKMGINSCPDIISPENCEYVAQLLAVEAAVLGHVRSKQDRDIVMRVCDQFLASGIPELRGWAIWQMKKQESLIQSEMQSCEVILTKLLQALEDLEAQSEVMATCT